MKHKKTFLGIGWKFPPTFDKRIKSVEMFNPWYSNPLAQIPVRI